MLSSKGSVARGSRAATLAAVALHFRRVTSDVGECREDNFGLAVEGPNWKYPFERGVEHLRCKFAYRNASEVGEFVLNYYPSIQTFADFAGVDLVPERHHEYPKSNWPRHRDTCKLWKPGKNGPDYQTDTIQLGECSLPQADGGGYIIQRVGPLVSTGNYDYWQFGWKDVWSVSRLLKKHPEGIAFTSSFSGPIDPHGRTLGHPPIHIHHIHITPEPGVAPKMDGMRCMKGDRDACYVANLVIEQHGDYQCFEEDGGIDCFFEKTAEGYAKLITKPLDLEGEINDVRAPNSEPLTWWYQVVLRWHPRKGLTLRPLSQHFFVGPGKMNPRDQRHNVAVFPVKAKRYSVYWYTGRMPRDGVMARNKLHSHNTMFDRGFFFSGTPADLGLGAPEFMPDVSYVPRMLHRVGFESHDDLQRFLLKNLNASAQRFKRDCPSGRCGRQSPSLVCQSWVSNADFVDPVSGKVFAYDRRAPACCRPWSFRKGDQFTVVAFMAPMKTPPGPWQPDSIPDLANMHIHWLMSYESLDNQSHYSTAMYCQNPDRALNYGDGSSKYPIFDMMYNALFYNQGTLRNPHIGVSNRNPTFLESALVVTALTVRKLLIYPRTLVGALAVVLFTCSVCLYRCCRASLRRRRVKLATAWAKQVPCCPDGVTVIAETVQRCAEAGDHSD